MDALRVAANNSFKPMPLHGRNFFGMFVLVCGRAVARLNSGVRRQMKHGPGWVILEEGLSTPKALVTILPARRSVTVVADLIEQLYIDRHSSITERLDYKKSRGRATYKPMIDPFGCIIHCGHNPWLVAIPARSIELHGNDLSFTYRIAVDHADPLNPRFEDRQQSIKVDA